MNSLVKIMLRNILSIFVIAGMILQLSWAGMLVGSAEIHAPAVILQTNRGALTTINLNITRGNGNVSIFGPQSIGSSTIESAITASKYASSRISTTTILLIQYSMKPQVSQGRVRALQ